MNASAMLCLALAAVLLPPGWGLAVPCVAGRLGANGAERGGMLLLALARCALAAQTSGADALPAAQLPAIGARAPPAVRLEGRWRVPPGGTPHLETSAGAVLVTFERDVGTPLPGERVAVLGRLDGSGHVRGVAIERLAPPSGAWIDRWAAAAGARLEQLVAPAQRGLVAALVLGRRRDLPLPIERDAIATGTMHLFALSGLHVGLAAVMLRRGLGALGHTSVWLQGALLAVFVALAGAQPPLCRAFSGWTLGVVATHTARGGSGLHRLGAAALLLLAWDPALVHSRSAQLSFVAVGGLLAGLRIGGPALGWLTGPAGAFLTTAPLCAAWFGRLAPWGVLVTPIVMPLVAFILLLGLAAIVPGELFAALDPGWSAALSGAARAMEWLLARLAAVCPAPLRPPPLAMPPQLASAVVLAALLVLARERSARAAGREEHVA